MLSARDPLLRSQAAELLITLKRADAQVVSAILTSVDPPVRGRRDYLLNELVRTDQRVVTALRSLLASGRPNVRYNVANFLAGLGQVDDQVASALRSSMSSKEPGVRLNAARALLQFDQNDDHAKLVLRSLLSSAPPHIRFSAAGLLRDLGHVDDQVISGLIHWDAPFALSRLTALARTDARVVSAARERLSADQPKARYEAVRLLEGLGLADEQVLSNLITAIDPTATAAIDACRKLYRQTWPTGPEANSLAALLHAPEPQPDRQWLFSWAEARYNEIQHS